MGLDSTRRRFLVRASALLGALWARGAALLLPARPHAALPSVGASGAREAALTHGPFIGHVSTEDAMVWARCSAPGAYRLVCRGGGASEAIAVSTATAHEDGDLCVVWRLTGLEPGQRYTCEIESGSPGPLVATAMGASFVTAPSQSAPIVTRLAIGSCSREDAGSAAVWRRMAALDPHVVVLLGDTPYIDSTELEVQRARYRDFASVSELADLVSRRPLYATWDDHDFGANDTDGTLAGKEISRRAFIEYHANPSYGDGSSGIYTSFRHGSVEVFLLDTRYFAATEPSPADRDRPTLLGSAQWSWLTSRLRASTAPFKLLASGMIWNGAVRPGKPDHWETYAHERDALFRFIGEQGISGVVLLGGDIHRTRVLRYDTTDVVGYPLTELVTSPIHGDVIETANVPHPALVHDSGEPHSFLLLTVDATVSPPTLLAEFQNAAGRELHRLDLDATTLSRPTPRGGDAP